MNLVTGKALALLKATKQTDHISATVVGERDVGLAALGDSEGSVFLAFNTSTAFSPMDVPVLARWAKGLMMVQSLISLTVIVLLAARAVNIL
jgi:hypothetical protein